MEAIFYAQIFERMYTVYILYSPKFNKTYTGFTSNLSERMKSHNKLGTKGYTTKYRPWQLIYTEEYPSKREATQREKFFKSGKGRILKQSILRDKGLISA